MSVTVDKPEKRYWVVSPNVNYDERTVSAWGRASVLKGVAFMGWHPNHKYIGHKFAHVIAPGHIILIARRHKFKAQVVGFGVVRDNYKTRMKGLDLPEGGSFGSLRILSPFVDLTIEMPPKNISLIKGLGQISALAELHPERDADHQRICEWIDNRLSQKGKRRPGKYSFRTQDGPWPNVPDTYVAAPPRNFQLDFKIRTRKEVTIGKRNEARLLGRFRQWLSWQGRQLPTFKCNKLQCDGFEESPRNLIEAKATTSRENLRMAVGQLFDYAYQAKKKFGKLNKAILVPKKPTEDLERWLRDLSISLIWPDKGTFRDNAKDQFV